MQQRPRIGIGVIIVRFEQVLLMKRKNSHGAESWSPPGGHLEFGESLEACAIRETREETAISITNPTFRAITNDFFEIEGKHYITIWMQALYQSGEATVNAPGEASEVGWFSWTALPSPLFLPLVNLLAGKSYPAIF